LTLAALLGLNLVTILAWPWLPGEVRRGLDPLYSWLCHRMPQRCYVWGGEPMPVCARCLGVWLGLAAMAPLALARGPWRLRAGLLLMAWTFASWVLGHWLPASWHLERTLAGFAGGLGLCVVAARTWGAARRCCRRVLDRL
jgi:uncharacterized membrane protein